VTKANPHTLMVIYAKDAKDWKAKARRFRVLAKVMSQKVNKDKYWKEAGYAEEKAKKFHALAEQYKRRIEKNKKAK